MMWRLRGYLSVIHRLGAGLLAVIGLHCAHAQTYYIWDAISGNGQGGSGSWDTTTTSRWSTPATTTPSLSFVSSASSIAVFQGTPGSIYTSNSIFTAGGLWTRVDGYTVDLIGVTFGSAATVFLPSTNSLFVTDLGTTILTGTLKTPGPASHVIKEGNGILQVNASTTSSTAFDVIDGTLQMRGSYAGSTNFYVNGGVLELGASANFSSGTLSTTVNAGTLRLLDGVQLPSQWAPNLLSATAIFEIQSDRTLTGNTVFAANGFTKTGAGKLTVTNILAANYNSDAVTSVTEGALRYEGGGGPNANTAMQYGGRYILSSGTSLEFGLLNDATYAGVMSGEGSFTKDAAKTLIMTGNNLNYGGTTIAAGTLQLGDGGITGSLPNSVKDIVNFIFYDPYVTNNAHLSFKRSDTVTADYFISGTGNVSQDGTGVVILAKTNTYSGGTTVNAGAIQWSSLANFGTGNITLNGGGLRWANGNTIDVSARLAAIGSNGATFDTNGNNVTLATGLTGAGGLFKTGAGVLTLTGASSFAGNTTVTTGALALASGSLATGSTLVLNGGTLQAVSGGSTLANSMTLAADSTLGGSNALTVTGALSLGGFKALNVTNTAQTTLAGGIVETSPSLLIKQGAGELQLTGASTYTGGTFIQAGTVRINNSTGSAFGTGAVTIASGATLAGAGSFTGALQLNGTFSPGNSPGLANTGSETWAGGGTYLWEINSGTGVAGPTIGGAGWDLLTISGSLNITATSGNRFNVDLTSLTLGNVAGLAANFDSGHDHTFLIAATTGGITGFSADSFDLDLTGFQNDLAGGSWSIAQSGNNLNLVFTAASAIPEPSTYAALIGFGALGFALFRRRRAT